MLGYSRKAALVLNSRTCLPWCRYSPIVYQCAPEVQDAIIVRRYEIVPLVHRSPYGTHLCVATGDVKVLGGTTILVKHTSSLVREGVTGTACARSDVEARAFSYLY